jgi:hypothetical protein
MRRVVIVLLLITITAVALFAAVTGTRYAPARQLFREAMSELAGTVNIMEGNDLEVVKIDMDLIGLESPTQTLKKLTAKFNYVISVSGQPTLIDTMALAVFYIPADGDIKFIKEDTHHKPTVTLTPDSSGVYMIVVRAVKMKPGKENLIGYYSLAIAHD